MIVHVVEAGQTLSSIAQQYGVSTDLIIAVNELPNPERLVVGQSLAIRIPETTYTVQAGDTLTQIAQQFGVSTNRILQNNPRISANNNVLTAGETIFIKFRDEEPVDTIVVNGYAYTFIDRTVLRKTLPFLTYLLIFSYGFTPTGELVSIDDEELIAIAQEYGVAPAMVLTPMNEKGEFSSELASQLFRDDAAEDRLIENIVTTMQAKGYRAIDIDFEFILPEDKEAFLSFITKMQNRLSQEGLLTFVALAPKISGTMTGLLYEAHDYPSIGAAADDVLLMTYEWGYTYGPPMATAPINNMRRVLSYGVSVIDPSKILMGIANYAYDWPLPFIRGETAAETLSNQMAIERAADNNVIILFDEPAQSPYYYYTNPEGIQHVVWFDDVRSMNAKLRLMPEFGLNGGSIWQIMNFFPGLYNVLSAYFTIVKV